MNNAKALFPGFVVIACTLFGCAPAVTDVGEGETPLRAGYIAVAPTTDVAVSQVSGWPDQDTWVANVQEAITATGSDGDGSFVRLTAGRSEGAHTVGFSGGATGRATDVIIKAIARTAERGAIRLDVYSGNALVRLGTWQSLTPSYSKVVSEVQLPTPISIADLNVQVALKGVGSRYSSVWIETKLAAASTWTWDMSAIVGGGLGQVIAADPFNPGFATIGGDSWGVYNTKTRGDRWLAATKGLTERDVSNGLFNYAGIAYSRKYPGTVYGLTGRVANPAGGFVAVEGNSTRVINTAVSGGYASLDRSDHPRPTGHRVLVDFDAVSQTEYIYIGGGNGTGVHRSVDGGKTFQKIALGGTTEVINGMALDPMDPTTLYVGTRDGAFRVTNIRGSAVSTRLTAAPVRVEELTAIGGSVYAAAHLSGVFRLSDKGTVWTRLGAGFFTSTSEWSAIGGSGKVLYAGCANPADGKSVAKSIDGGVTWTWVSMPSNISIVPWGRTEAWWLALAFERIIMGNGTFEVTDIAVDAFDSDIVYLSSRSGAWKSEDGGAHWRPAVNGLGGTMHTKIVARSGGGVETDDVDWLAQTSTDGFRTATRIATAISDSQVTLDLTKNGRRYQVTNTFPRDFLVDGVSIADEFFRATCVRATDIDVSDDGNTIYVAQFGGGVIVARRGATSP